MLKSISWGDYFSSLLFLALVYYIVIGYRYFRNELLKLAGVTRYQPNEIPAIAVENLGATQQSTPNELAQSGASPDDVDITRVVQAFIDEAEAYLEQAAADKPPQQEILFALQRLSARYPVLTGSDFKAGLVKDVDNLVNSYFPNSFTASELKPYLFT